MTNYNTDGKLPADEKDFEEYCGIFKLESKSQNKKNVNLKRAGHSVHLKLILTVYGEPCVRTEFIECQ